MLRFIWLSVFLVVSFMFCTQAMGGYKVQALSSKEVQDLLNNQTVNVVKEKSRKGSGKGKKFQAFISNMGTMRTMHPEGESAIFNWSVGKNGYFCMKNTMTQSGKGKTCGYFVKEGSNVYKLYRLKGSKAKGGKVVYANKKILLLTINGRVAGNKL